VGEGEIYGLVVVLYLFALLAGEDARVQEVRQRHASSRAARSLLASISKAFLTLTLRAASGGCPVCRASSEKGVGRYPQEPSEKGDRDD
jgi:hypothetical protein